MKTLLIKSIFFIFSLTQSYLIFCMEQYTISSKSVNDIKHGTNSNSLMSMIETTYLVSNTHDKYLYSFWYRNRKLHTITKLNITTGINQLYQFTNGNSEEKTIWGNKKHKTIWPTAIHIPNKDQLAIAVTESTLYVGKTESIALIKIFKDNGSEPPASGFFSSSPDPEKNPQLLELLFTLQTPQLKEKDKIVTIGSSDTNWFALSKQGYLFTWSKNQIVAGNMLCPQPTAYQFTFAIILPSGGICMAKEDGAISTIPGNITPTDTPADSVPIFTNSAIASLQTSADGTLLGMINQEATQYAIHNTKTQFTNIYDLPKDLQIKAKDIICPVTNTSCCIISKSQIYILEKDTCTLKKYIPSPYDRPITLDSSDAIRPSKDGVNIILTATSVPCHVSRPNFIINIKEEKITFFSPIYNCLMHIKSYCPYLVVPVMMFLTYRLCNKLYFLAIEHVLKKYGNNLM